MGGFLIIEDGRAVAPSNWGFDRMIESIAGSLPTDSAAKDLRKWLLDQRVCIRGLGSVDVRELTESNRRMFWDAVANAVELADEQGADDWHEPSLFLSWLKMFRDLLLLHQSYLRGEAADSFNPYMRSVIPPTNERSGPGWKADGTDAPTSVSRERQEGT